MGKRVCVVRQDIFKHDLRLFNTAFATASQQSDPATTTEQALTAGLKVLTERHCPFDVTTRLRQRLSELRNTREMSVDDYANRFEYLQEVGAFVQLDVSQNDRIALFHSGMPKSWRSRVEFLRILNQDEALLELRANYKVCERQEAEGLQHEGERRRGDHGRNNKKCHFTSHENSKPQGSGKVHQKTDQKNKGKRQREVTGDKDGKGCNYCEEQGMPFFRNHADSECFRNSDSSCYRPNANERLKKNFGNNKKSKSEVNAVQYYSDDSSDTDVEAAYAGLTWDSYDQHDIAAARTPMTTCSGMQLRVQVRHPFSKKTVLALLDSGCNKSTVAKEVVSWYVPNQQGQYRNAAGNMEKTCGSIDLPLKIEDFGASRQLTHLFQIADTLLYPIILGTDFMEEQGIILDFKERKIWWDGASIPMIPANKTKDPVYFAVSNEEDRVGRILDGTGRDVDINALVPKKNLSLEQQQRLEVALRRVKVVFLGPVGKLKLPPYILPVKANAIPSAQAPYSVPHKLHAATLKEIERLVRLGVLEPNKESPWAAPASVIPKKEGSVRFLSDFRQLSKWLERRYFSLPKIQDMIRELPQPGFITTLDLVMGYYSRELALQSRPYTAIVLPWGSIAIAAC